MLAKTQGIVIRNTRYGEGSVISKIYTRQFGMQSFIINGIYNAKSTLKASLLQPLVLLDLVIYHHKLKDIQRIKEAKCQPQLVSLHFDNAKAGICMFVSEVLNKTIMEEEPNEGLYDFIENSILLLDADQGAPALWPILFLINLSKWLGFGPDNNFDEPLNVYFDLQAGMFCSSAPDNAYLIAPPESEYFSRLISYPTEKDSITRIPKPARKEIMNKLVLYYKLHLPDFKDIRSIEVLSGMA